MRGRQSERSLGAPLPLTPLVVRQSVDMAAYRRMSRALWRWQQDDYGGMRQELQALFPNTASRLAIRPDRLVYRYCVELGGARYARPPRRQFMDRRRTSSIGTAKLEREYASLGVDAFMRGTNELEVAQNAVIIARVPDLRGGSRLERWAPWEAAVELEDSGDGDLRHAREVRLSWGAGADQHGNVLLGEIVLTPTEAWYEVEGKFIRPVFRERVHGLGMVPVIGWRAAEQMARGLWFPPVNEALYYTQIATSCGLSFAELVAHIHTFPKDFYESSGGGGMVPESLAYTPDGGIILPPDVTVNRVQSDPALDKAMMVTDAMKSALATNSHMSPVALAMSSGITGNAKEVERIGEVKERERQEQDWSRRERDLLWLIAATDGLMAGRAVDLDPADFDVRVDYQYPEAKTNDLQHEQAFNLRWARGLDSDAERASREDGLPLPADIPMDTLDLIAWRVARYVENMRALRAAGVDGPMDGEDKSAQAFGAGVA